MVEELAPVDRKLRDIRIAGEGLSTSPNLSNFAKPAERRCPTRELDPAKSDHVDSKHPDATGASPPVAVLPSSDDSEAAFAGQLW